MYTGARFWTDLDRLFLPEVQIDGLRALVRSFSRVGQYKLALLLSLLAATLHLGEYAHLQVCPIQWYLK